MGKTVIIKIKRQENPGAAARWEEFELTWRPGMNVISAMMEIAANPVTRSGQPTTPIAYDSNCLEEVCGSCAMLINGRARMACSALVDKLEPPITLEPFKKFPVVRDLQVDRSVIFENLKRVKAWVPIDGTYDLGAGPRVSPQEQEWEYPVTLHLLLLLHGSLSPVQRANRICRRRDHRPGPPVQSASHGSSSQARTPAGAHGRWRHPGMRFWPELRGGLSQRYTPHDSHLRHWSRSDEAGNQGFLPRLAIDSGPFLNPVIPNRSGEGICSCAVVHAKTAERLRQLRGIGTAL